MLGRTAAWTVAAALLIAAATAAADSVEGTPLDRHGITVYPLIVVGDPAGTPPDSPDAHVDANLPTSPYSGVGAVRSNVSGGGYYLGSGVLIGPRHVLTTGHMIDTNHNGTVDFAPGDVSFYFNNAATPTVIAASALTLHPDFTGFDHPSVNDDLAILTLSADAPAGVPVYSLWTAPIAAGAQTIHVGYGRSGDGLSGYTTSASLTIKRVGANVIDAFEEDDDLPAGNGIHEVWRADFDGPTADTNLLGGLTLGNAVETCLGPGDSGGPNFIDVGGQLRLVGINTFGYDEDGHPVVPYYGSGLGGILVESYVPWINSVVPEPASLTLLAAGLTALTLRRKARQ